MVPKHVFILCVCLLIKSVKCDDLFWNASAWFTNDNHTNVTTGASAIFDVDNGTEAVDGNQLNTTHSVTNDIDGIPVNTTYAATDEMDGSVFDAFNVTDSADGTVFNSTYDTIDDGNVTDAITEGFYNATYTKSDRMNGTGGTTEAVFDVTSKTDGTELTTKENIEVGTGATSGVIEQTVSSSTYQVTVSTEATKGTNGTKKMATTVFKTTADTTTVDDDELLGPDEGNGTIWGESGCVNASESETLRINATGRTPVRFGQWTLVRWGFYGTDWMCDLKGRRTTNPSSPDLIDTLSVTVNPSGAMEVGNMQMRCNAIKGPSCNPTPWTRRSCQQGQSISYCFRLRIRCTNTELDEEQERLRAQKWTMFGYGALSGFVIGCILTAIAMMCMDDCCQIQKPSERKKCSRQ